MLHIQFSLLKVSLAKPYVPFILLSMDAAVLEGRFFISEVKYRSAFRAAALQPAGATPNVLSGPPIVAGLYLRRTMGSLRFQQLVPAALESRP